jgi:putative nucleotidyltransferase with HDIG domain
MQIRTLGQYKKKSIVNAVFIKSEIAEARNRLDTQLDDLVNLRPLPEIASRIMTACRQEGTDVRALVQLVECDPVISSRVLSVVNSSLFGYSREVSSINQAVVVLGLNKLSQLAVSVASESVFNSGDAAGEGRRKLYEHSLGCAAVSRLLASISGCEAEAGEAFLAGMLHDVGKLVLFDVAPHGYSELQANESEMSSVELERQTFGIDHSELGAKIAENWGLPFQINGAIANHHCEIESSTDSLSQLTSLSNDLARTWGIGQEQRSCRSHKMPQWLVECDPAAMEELRAQALDQFKVLKALLTS